MKRVVVLAISVQPPGGGNGVGAWTLQALQDHCELVALTWEPLDVEAVDAYFGTAIDPRRVRRVSPPRWLRRAVERMPVQPLPTLKKSLLALIWRLFLRRPEDVVIATHGEMSFGHHGIQYVHFPLPLEDKRYLRTRWNASLALGAYRVLCALIGGGWRRRDLLENVTLVNSEFTARSFHASYGLWPRVVYPPALARPSQIPWTDRCDRFVCLGRMCRSKQLENVIDILRDVRARGFDVGLDIVGAPDDRAYERAIRRLARDAFWIRFRGPLPRADLDALLATSRYGLHGMRREHFGMAVAEMVRAGCVVFVPDDGGPVEIVGDGRLQYRDNADAVDKICAVLGSSQLRDELRATLEARAALWSSDRFMAQMREVVASFTG